VKTRAAILHVIDTQAPFANSKPLKIEEIELDEPGAGEVLVKVAAAGLCHSDLSVITTMNWAKSSWFLTVFFKMNRVSTRLVLMSKIQRVPVTRPSPKQVARCLSNSGTWTLLTMSGLSSTPSQPSGIKDWFQGSR
jgi:hypothetical protein